MDSQNEDDVERPACSPSPVSTGSAFLRTLLQNLETKPVFDTPDDAYQQGQAAASQAYRRDENPYPQGTALREWWDGGWCDDTDELCGPR